MSISEGPVLRIWALSFLMDRVWVPDEVRLLVPVRGKVAQGLSSGRRIWCICVSILIEI